jgi:hypothetical protein
MLYRKYKNMAFVLDDESYCTLSHSNINGNDNFYTSAINLTPPEVKFKTKAKYEPKLLVWIAASPKGLSKPFVAPSGLAINAEIYQEECIRKRLIPFVRKYHSDGKYVFWPDLASSHYANTTIDLLIDENVPYVEKYENPANTPEVRPIEDLWGVLKGMIYENGWTAKNLDELEKRIRLCVRKIDITSVQRIFEKTLTRLDNIRRFGVRESQK